MNPTDLPYFSIVRGGPFYRYRRAVGLIPEKGLGLAKRVVFIVAVTWLPIVIAALLSRRALPGQGVDPLFRHFGLHARMLIAIPLLILAEGSIEAIVPDIVRQFVKAGFVTGEVRAQFDEALRKTERLRDSLWGLVLVIAAMVNAIILSSGSNWGSDEMTWAVDQQGQTIHIGFGGWWLLFVGRPVFSGFLAIWFWRLLVGGVLIWRISKLDLHLVPSHPDRAGGLAFVSQLSKSYAPIVFAISVVIAGRWAHDVLYHGVHVDDLKPMLAVYVGAILLIFVAPLLLFSRNLRSYKRKSILEYGALIGAQGRLVREKWIGGHDVGDPPIFDSPELGPTVDISSIYTAVAQMRLVPIGKDALIPILAAIALPMLPVFAIEIPIKDLLLKVGKSLI